jgi:hypothetical protein
MPTYPVSGYTIQNALMDGVHMGRLYAKMQDCLHHSGFVLGEA